MTENSSAQVTYQTPTPDPALKRLGDALVGTWQVSGGAQGQVRYEWMDGGFFLMQHVELGDVRGLEVIGHLHLFGEEPSEDIKSRFYGNAGETFDYVYELDGSTLTIWGGERGSPAYYRGTFSDDGSRLSGAWVYPDGGGYESTSTRVG
jgi:hypothetical protein